LEVKILRSQRVLVHESDESQYDRIDVAYLLRHFGLASLVVPVPVGVWAISTASVEALMMLIAALLVPIVCFTGAIACDETKTKIDDKSSFCRVDK
jgi:hypothetical protein